MEVACLAKLKAVAWFVSSSIPDLPFFYWSSFVNRMNLIDLWKPSGFMFLNKIRTKNEQRWSGVWCHDQRRGRRRRSINNIIGVLWTKFRNGIQRMNFEGRCSNFISGVSSQCHGGSPFVFLWQFCYSSFYLFFFERLQNFYFFYYFRLTFWTYFFLNIPTHEDLIIKFRDS